MEKFNIELMKKAMASVAAAEALEKSGFVPMPGGQAEPVAGASQATAALSAGGMGGQEEQPVDPSTGMPVDPSTGLPMDPNAGMPPGAEGMPPEGMPPEGMPPEGMPPGPPPGAGMEAGGIPGATSDGMITMPVSQFIQLLETLGAAGGPKKGGGKSSQGQGQGQGMESQISSIYQALSNAGVLQQPQ